MACEARQIRSFIVKGAVEADGLVQLLPLLVVEAVPVREARPGRHGVVDDARCDLRAPVVAHLLAGAGERAGAVQNSVVPSH